MTFSVRGVVFVSRLGQRRVRPGLVQVDVCDIQTDVVFSLEAGEDGGNSRHQRSKVRPQFRIGVPTLEHNAVPVITANTLCSEDGTAILMLSQQNPLIRPVSLTTKLS